MLTLQETGSVPDSINRPNIEFIALIIFYYKHLGRGFEPHRCHCVMVLEQDTFILA